MLPPVRAALNLNTDHPEVARAPAQPATAHAHTEARPAQAENAGPPVSQGRMSALAVSAQLQLGHGLSDFADTIGKLLDLPRGEAETLADYSARLSQALQSLSPAERTNVERLLNQIVKGQSLRLLIQSLQNPAGPDAARLAVLIELAAAGGKNEAIKAIVQSYRQYAGSPALQPVPNSAAPGQAPAPPGSTTSASTAASRPPATSSSQVFTGSRNTASAFGAPAPAPLEKGDASGHAVKAGQPTPRLPLALAEAVAKALQAINAYAVVEAQNAPNRPASGALQQPKDSLPARAPEPQAPLDKAPPKVGATTSAETDAGARSQTGVDPEQAAFVKPSAETAADLRRHEVTKQGTNTTAPRPPTARSNEVVFAPLASALPGVLLEVGNDASPPQLLRPALRGASGGADVSQQEAVQAKEPEAASSSFQSGQPIQDGEPEDHSSRQTQHPQPPFGQKAGETLDRQLANILPLGLVPIARDGVPWSHVPYPPGDEEPRREERKARPVDAIGDEEDQPPRQEHGFQQGQQQDESEDGAERDAEIEKQPQAILKEGQPDDFYWRMAGWN